MASSATTVEITVVRAYDLREEAKNVDLMGSKWHVKPPKVIPLVPAGALLEGQISEVFRLVGDLQNYYRVQVDSQAKVSRYEYFADLGRDGHLKEADGLLLTGSLTDVMVRLNHAHPTGKPRAIDKVRTRDSVGPCTGSSARIGAHDELFGFVFGSTRSRVM